LAILSCPGCGHRLRVPDNKRGTVTCPLCSSEWFHPETIELSSVEFRCSASGAKFNVIGSRRSPLHKFTVQKVEKAGRKATGPLEAGSRESSPQLGPRNAPPALPPATPGVVGWLARIVGRKADVIPSKPIREVPNAQRTTTAISATTNNADEYNWSGFFCPYCNAAGFVSCGGGHLPCDGTVQVRKDGRFHQCFCGHGGFISGMIKTYKNERLSVAVEVDRPNAPRAAPPQQNSKTADVAIPTPAQRLPAKR
jgi:hypothetical protein